MLYVDQKIASTTGVSSQIQNSMGAGSGTYGTGCGGRYGGRCGPGAGGRCGAGGWCGVGVGGVGGVGTRFVGGVKIQQSPSLNLGFIR